MRVVREPSRPAASQLNLPGTKADVHGGSACYSQAGSASEISRGLSLLFSVSLPAVRRLARPLKSPRVSACYSRGLYRLFEGWLGL